MAAAAAAPGPRGSTRESAARRPSVSRGPRAGVPPRVHAKVVGSWKRMGPRWGPRPSRQRERKSAQRSAKASSAMSY